MVTVARTRDSAMLQSKQQTWRTYGAGEGRVCRVSRQNVLFSSIKHSVRNRLTLVSVTDENFHYIIDDLDVQNMNPARIVGTFHAVACMLFPSEMDSADGKKDGKILSA